MMDLIGDVRSDICAQVVRQKDNLLAELISEQLGIPALDITNPEKLKFLVGRLSVQITNHPYTEKFILDGAPLIEFYREEFSQDQKDLSHYLTVTMKHRILVKRKEPCTS